MKILLKSFFAICFFTLSQYNFAIEPNTAEQHPTILYVNINTADLEMLADLLTGVGEKKAQAIIDYRDEFGFFENADDLVNVKGIGPSLLRKNREAILVDLPVETES